MNSVFINLKNKYADEKNNLKKMSIMLKVLTVVLFVFTFVNFFYSLVSSLSHDFELAALIIVLVIAGTSLFSTLAFMIIVYQKKLKNLQLLGNISCLSTMLMSLSYLKDNSILMLVAVLEFGIALAILIILDKYIKSSKLFGFNLYKELIRNAKAVNDDFYSLIECVSPQGKYAERENMRLLPFNEIMESNMDNIIPIIDLYNNTYVVYDYNTNKIVKYNTYTKESLEENNINQYLTLFNSFISKGRLFLTGWLMNEKALGKEPFKLEYTNTIRFDDNFCNIYKFMTEDNSEWLIGISSNIGEFSKFLPYNKETEQEDAKALFNILNALIENQKLQNIVNSSNE